MFEGFKPRQDLVGYTAVPNEWFDKVLKSIDNLAELKVVQIVFRKTYGWVQCFTNDEAVYKVTDHISYSQFAELTGLSTRSISQGIAKAIEHGYIVCVSKGSYLHEASAYRIRFTGEQPQQVPKDEVQILEEQTPTIPVTPVIEPEVQKGFAQEIVKTEEPKKEPVKRKSQYERYKEKDKKDYNAVDMTFYFRDRYYAKVGVAYGLITQKDRSLMKQLIDGYGVESVVSATDYFTANYSRYINGYPSISALYGFRTSVFPESQKGVKVQSNRECVLTEEQIKEKEGDVTGWN